MSSAGYDLGPAVNGGQGDETSNLGDTTATVMARLDVALKDMPGVTTLDKLNTLMSKVAAAKELLGGLEPDVLLQARSKVDEPDRELSMSPALVKAYEHISKNTQGTLTRSKKIQTLMSTTDAPEDEFEAAMWAAFAAGEKSETSQEGTHPQESPLQDTHRIMQPPRVRPHENTGRQSNPAEQEASSETPTPESIPRPKQIPRWTARCSKEERHNLSPADNLPCPRKACNFLHDDQHAYMVEGLYRKDVSTGKIQAWGLKPYTSRAGHNMGLEKVGKNDQNFDAFFKKLKNKDKATETKAKEEYAQKKKKTSTLEVKAAPDAAHKSTKAATDAEATAKAPPKKRKVAATTGAKGTAEQPAKKSKGGEADR
ncbi:uncharacterized protein J4E78_005793 [Alternaria triticimaculans]|uniref:uncharacterized protein n=1 Tax=Alternaria triticimaculans TaxID=297637 RepID=UPI0020C2BC46|nr:uncharacterized protein J4E78_005793 [Alternaria triticimaculans]KAI4659366.1 hypothetical protein J4E78_005793 [Alternaria triticimaculans]